MLPHRVPAADVPARRVLGLLLVVVFLLVLVAGFAHAADLDHAHGARDCGLCLALVQMAVVLAVATACLLARDARDVARAPASVPRVRRDARPPPARGPPSTL